jgi:tyrosine-protein phosphatase non-receptor type 23
VTHSNYTANVQQAQPQQQTQQPATNYQNLSDCKNDTRATPTITNHAPGQPTFPTQSQTKQITSPVETPKKQYRSENMDLLSGIDFSIASPSIETVPTLQPQTIKTEPMLSKNEDVLSEILSPKLADPTDRKSSVDNLSNCSDISSIDQNFDWESVSVKQESPKKTVSDPFDNPNVLKLFHKEVERMEKFFESLTIKTLSGVTPLDNKWKELQDLLVGFF